MNTLNLTNRAFPFWTSTTELDKFVSDLFGSDFQSIFNSLNTDPYPTDQYYNKEGNLIVEVPLAGYKKEDISLSIEDGSLVLSVKKHDKVKDVQYVKESIRKKAITQKWYIDDHFEQSKISSVFEDGLLKITLPVKKPEEKKSTKTNINIG